MEIKELFLKYGFILSDKDAKAFMIYRDYLLSENEKYNLTAITDDNEVLIKHFLDSVMGERFIKKGASVLDIGSGAGFPAIPIAIARKDVIITMIDGTGKKVNFLKQVIEKLNLTNATVDQIRAEEFSRKNRDKFDVVTARAVAFLPKLIEYGVPALKVGGKLIAYKSEEAEIKEAKGALFSLGAKFFSAKTYDLEGNRRALIVIEKTCETPEVYPRTGKKLGIF